MFHVDSLSVPVVRGGNWIDTGRTLFVGCVGPALITLAFLDWDWDWDSSSDSALRFDMLVVEVVLFGGILNNKAVLWCWKSPVSIGRGV